MKWKISFLFIHITRSLRSTTHKRIFLHVSFNDYSIELFRKTVPWYAACKKYKITLINWAITMYLLGLGTTNGSIIMYMKLWTESRIGKLGPDSNRQRFTRRNVVHCYVKYARLASGNWYLALKRSLMITSVNSCAFLSISWCIKTTVFCCRRLMNSNHYNSVVVQPFLERNLKNAPLIKMTRMNKKPRKPIKRFTSVQTILNSARAAPTLKL